ncbi:hypothetical protein FOL47_011137 [Perkinsus chesapeaki]|uniref:DUF5703 domain-containing protein n=1 Tax=Perkinsus chesapeaki TaxID=330153 RepID=A0A7J6L0N9_PERCH|nr:hypothetical protein FOL47_011137 [Perkinsus chesapeaki]
MGAVVIDIDMSSPQGVSISTTAELLRPVPSSFIREFDCVTYNISADSYLLGEGTGTIIGWSHLNDNTNFTAQTLTQLNLEHLYDMTEDRLHHRHTAAVWNFSEPMNEVSEGTVKTRASVKTLRAVIAVATTETEASTKAPEGAMTLIGAYDPKPAWQNHTNWWENFWNTSWIEISGEKAEAVNEKYTLQRYIQAVQARQPYPLKFNGMLFTAQRDNPDYRKWGGSNWWQNARMPYYNMLVSGDFSMQTSLFKSYLATLPFAIEKTKIYFPGMKGIAAYWDEYVHPLIGTTHPSKYGCDRAGKSDPPIWYSDDPWNHYNLQGALDLSLLMLDHYAWTEDDETLKENLVLIDSVINFYSQWRTTKDDNGKIVLFPTQSVETWQCPGYENMVAGVNCTKNDQPTISGLWAVVTRLLRLPASLTTPDQRAKWEALLSALPAIPTTKSSEGGTKLAPCEVCSPVALNAENADLYAVHPYRNVTVKYESESHLQLAKVAYEERRFKTDLGWNQNVMDAALIGLASEAERMVIERASYRPARGYRFPVFAPHLQDYAPSGDHYAVMNNAIVYMLLQPMDDELQNMILFPAWPCHWNVSFKLWGPGRTVLEGSLINGHLEGFKVYPATREQAVVIRSCQI